MGIELKTPDQSPSGTSAPTTRIANSLREGAALLQHRAARMVRWHAVLKFLTLLFSIVLLVAFLDRLIHRDEVGLRVIWLLIVIGVAGWGIARWLLPAWTFRPTALDIARWIAHSDGERKTDLSSVMQLAAVQDGDSRFGDQQYRDLAIRRWSESNAIPAWSAYQETPRFRRSKWCFAILVGILLVSSQLFPGQSLLAIRRIFLPFASAPWPRADELALLNLPTTVAIGAELQIEVIDQRPPLPSGVVLEIRDAPDGAPPGDVYRMPTQTFDDSAIATLGALEAPIEVRALGGDDSSMDWHRIDVVTPPEITDYVFTVIPPAYTRLPEEKLATRRIRVLSGSRVSLSGRLQTPLSGLEAKPITERTTVVSESSMDAASIRVRDDGYSFDLMAEGGGVWTPKATVAWQFTTIAPDDVEVLLPQTWSITVVDDGPPSIDLQSPIMDTVSKQVELPLVGIAVDDVGLDSVALRYRLEENGSDELAPTDDRRKRTDDAKALMLWTSKSRNDAFPREILVEDSWPVQESLVARDNVRLTFWLEATDSLGQVGRSSQQQIRFASDEQMIANLRERERPLIDMLQQLNANQERNFNASQSLIDELEQAGPLEGSDLRRLTSIEAIQQSIQRQLLEEDSSFLNQLDRLENLYQQNNLSADSAAIEYGRQLSQLRSKTESLRDSLLPDATAAASTARRLADANLQSGSASTVDQRVRDQVALTADAQASAMSEMQELLELMTHSAAVLEIRNRLRQALVGQESVLESTNRQRLALVASGAAMTTSMRRGLADNQIEIATQVESALQLIEATGAASSEGPPILSLLRQQIQDNRIIDSIRNAAAAIESNNLETAIPEQERVIESLVSALGLLQVNNTADRNALSENLAKLLSDLNALVGRQDQIAKALESEIPLQDQRQILQQQAEVEAATEDLRESISQSNPNQSSNSLDRALANQRAMQEELANGNQSAARDLANAANTALQSAAEELSARDSSASTNAGEAASRSLASLKRVLTEQESIVETLGTINADLSKDPAMSTEMQDRCERASVDQQNTRQTAEQAFSWLAGNRAIDWIASQIDQDMLRCAAAIERYRSRDAEDAALEALNKLSMVVESLESTVGQEDATPGQSQDATGEDAGRDDQPNDTLVTSLKLLRTMQAHINEQTEVAEQLDNQTRDRKLRTLAEQQDALGLQLERLLLDIANEGASE